MTHRYSDIYRIIHFFLFLNGSENLRQRICHWLRPSVPVIHMSRGKVDEWLNFPCTFVDCVYLWLYACVRVALWGDWMAVPPLIVELEDPSSYTLIMALCWRIPEASSLIDSSVPFLPRPATQNPAIVPPRTDSTVHRLDNSQAHNHTQYTPCTVCTDGSRMTVKHTWTYRKKINDTLFPIKL